MSYESASPRVLIKSWFPPCNASQDPTLDRKLNVRAKRTKPSRLGFLLCRQETQLAILETARKAICIVQTSEFHKRFTSISQLPLATSKQVVINESAQNRTVSRWSGIGNRTIRHLTKALRHRLSYPC